MAAGSHILGNWVLVHGAKVTTPLHRWARKERPNDIGKHPNLVLLRCTAVMATGDQQCSTPKNPAETNFCPLSYTRSDCPHRTSALLRGEK